MKKEITMTINQFMEVERGNITLNSVINNTKHPKFCKDTTLSIFGVIAFFSSMLPMLETNPSVAQVSKDTLTVIYVTTTVLLQCLYELTVKTATIL